MLVVVVLHHIGELSAPLVVGLDDYDTIVQEWALAALVEGDLGRAVEDVWRAAVADEEQSVRLGVPSSCTTLPSCPTWASVCFSTRTTSQSRGAFRVGDGERRATADDRSTAAASPRRCRYRAES